MYEQDLIAAVRGLGPGTRRWLGRALQSGWYRIAAGAYDNRPGGTRCPIAAAAMMAGIWSDGGIVEGYPEWGTPEEPSPTVEDFAAYFDLFSFEAGVKAAVDAVQKTLDADPRAKAA